MSFRLLRVALLLTLLPLVSRASLLFDTGSTWRWRKGTSEASLPDTTAWRQAGFDDSSWAQGPSAFFYGEALSGTELPDMRGGYTCVYLRKTFVVTNPADLSGLRLRALSDDGFAAWINGTPVARFNVPDGELAYTATAAGTFNEPLPTETYDIPGFAGILRPGTNVIAVQGFNASLASSSDFVFEASLEADVDEQAPLVADLIPPAGKRVAALTQIEVGFSEAVTGVDAADLRIGGIPATNVTAFAADRYVFEFAPVPRGSVTVSWSPTSGIHDLSSRRNPFAGGSWTYVVDPDLPPPGVSISEFMADNRRTLNDDDGDASDWIEIANTSDSPVSLAGWTLSDVAANPAKWRFPAVSVPGRGFLVVFASGKNRTNATARLHTNFKLAREGGYLGLFRPGAAVASEFAPAYPPQSTDVSYGRLSTDPLQTGYFPVPTPGAVNAEGGPGFAPEVEFSRIGGTFLEAFLLELRTADPAAAIHYTVDGSVPTVASPVYSAPFTVSASTRVRARSFVSGLLPGPIGAEYYVLLNPSAGAVASTLPLLVLHSFGRGTVPADGEYPAFFALHEPHGGVASLTNAPDLRTRARLNIRGSSTLGQAKHNYSVEFRDEREADRDLSPLGLPADSDWVLYAPNNFEPILIHNPLAYAMSREIGRYAPRTRFVEVYFQTGTGALAAANYVGIYVLMEKIKRGPDRVAIDALEPEHVREPQISGGYMLKIDRLDPGDFGLYAGGQGMGWVDPKEEDMNLPQRAVQRTWIADYLDRFWNALYSADWRDPVRGWRAYVDEDSWIDHHLLNVVTFNVDALRLSAHFHKPRGGKLEFGPVWDFDRALNSTDGRDANPKVWRSATGDQGTDFFNYPWWGRMFEDPDFWQRYIDRYQELRRAQFSTNHLFALIDQLTAEVIPAQPREAARWAGFTTPRDGSYQSEINRLKGWLGNRLRFMDTNFVARPELFPSNGVATAGAVVTLTGPAGATIYYTVDGADPRASGGAVAASAKVYQGPFSVPPGVVTQVRARALDPTHRNLTGIDRPPISSSWSGPVIGRFAAAPAPVPGALLVSEIQYRPLGPSALELARLPLAERSDFEFIELKNGGTEAVDLFDARFTQGIEFAFRTSSIPVLAPGARLVLVRNRAAFALRYGNLATVAGEYGGSLDGSGESLRLEDGGGRVLLDVRYRDGWYPTTDGLGISLVAVGDGTAFGHASGDWRPSAAIGGSPGGGDPVPPSVPGVVINEILTHTDPPLLDGIELANPTGAPAAIGGWFLTDDRSEPRKYRIPDGTVIPPGGYLWFDETTFNADTNAPTSFRLDSLGDAAWLFAADAAGTLLGYAHGTDFGSAPNGVSFGREVLCDGTEVFLAQSRVTPGTTNAEALRPPVVISEIHYHPPDVVLGQGTVNDTSLEFVELANRVDAPVALYDDSHRTNAWRLRGAVRFDFPTNVVLATGGRLVVVNFDPAANPQALARFRSAFPNLPPSIPLFGPMEGSLPNGGGRLELARSDRPQTEADPRPGFVPYPLVDGVTYSDATPWTASADGTGRSLQRPELEAIGDRPGVWVAAVPTPGQAPAAGSDTDADGMPDAWEVRACLDPNQAADAGEDADGDGASNGAEYMAGTDPRDPEEVLRWSGVTAGASGVELHFPAKAGRAYRVEVSVDAAVNRWQTLTDVSAGAADRTVTVSDRAADAVPRFYRLRVMPAN